MILIVEDDPQVARLINLVLKRSGFEGEIVSDGETALERASTNPPEMIFADLSIKGLAGEALCRKLKEEDSTRRIPFVIVSGDRDLEEKATGCGADDYLGKPFEFDELIRLVKKHVQHASHDNS